MNPESIHSLLEVGQKNKQEDYLWPIPGKATVNDRVFIVCDGAGSFDNGEIASKLICQFMAANVLKFGERKMSGELINGLLNEARDRLITYAREYRLDTDLSTTFSMLILYDQMVLVSWTGDSRIYQLRDGEIIFTTEDNAQLSKPTQRAAIARGIKADSSPIYAETKWIEDVQVGDYFLLCSKGLIENVTEDDIKLLVGRNDKTNMDLAGSFKQLAFEKTQDNYSMYLIKVGVGILERGVKSGIFEKKKLMSGIVRPFFILAVTIIGLLIMVFYFQNARTSDPTPKFKKQSTQPAEVLREDSVPSAIVIAAPLKPVIAVTDSVKNISDSPRIVPRIDSPEVIQVEEKPPQINQTPVEQKKRTAQLLIKFTTDESCKLKITNIDLDEVIDWDLSQDDSGTIFLKPGKYSIVATSVINSSKTKTYDFEVKPGYTHNTQNLHISF